MKSIFDKHAKALSLVLLPFGLYFTSLFPRMIQMRPDGLYLGHEHVWSDWPLHIGIAMTFATKQPQNWFTHHPMYAYGKFTYSFLTDLISSLFMRAGFSLELAFIIPSIILSLLLIVGMYALIFTVTKSKKVAVIAITLFFLSAGPGFLSYFSDVSLSPDFHTIFHPGKHYSRIDEYSWYAGNFIVGILIPQRAFLLGMTITVWVLASLIYTLKKDSFTNTSKIALVCAGVGAGILTIAHIHSFIAIVMISGLITIFSYRRWAQLVYYVLPATIVSLIFNGIFIAGGIQNSNFIHLQIGYTSKGGLFAWFEMWYRLWGLMIPSALLGLYLVRKQLKINKAFYYSFVLIFLIANCVLFQPVEWDNSKFFLWAYFGFSILTATVIVYLLNKQHAQKVMSLIPLPKFSLKLSHLISIAIAAVLFLTLTLTGVVELMRLWHTDENAFQAISIDDMNLGDKVRHETPQTAVFLTAPSTNHWVMMWASRPIMMGFVGWVYNFGFDYSQRLNDMHVMYQGGSAARELLKKYHISYVVIGPGEINDFNANIEYYDTNYGVKYRNNSYRVYDVRSISDN